MQNMLDEGVANVDAKIEARNIALAQEDALHKDEPVKQEEDDGHIETVEEVKAKMKALSDNMNQNLAAVDSRA
jgi:beta-lactamase class A